MHACDCDARKLAHVESQSVDRIVSDLPFNNKCTWNAKVELPLVLAEMLRVLKDGGVAVLLLQGFRALEKVLEAQEYLQCDTVSGKPGDGASSGSEGGPTCTESTRHFVQLAERRPVVIGGFACSVFVLTVAIGALPPRAAPDAEAAARLAAAKASGAAARARARELKATKAK